MSDMVNYLLYYIGFSNGVEVIDIMENFIFNIGNVCKYVVWVGCIDGCNKGVVIEDFNKVIWYLCCELECLGVIDG